MSRTLVSRAWASRASDPDAAGASAAAAGGPGAGGDGAVGSGAGSWRDAGCHCGAVRFRARLAGGLAQAWREDFALTAGADRLTRYAFNTGVAEHWFCARCGIYTHHSRRSTPGGSGINLACVEGLNPFDLGEAPVMDGVNHPADCAPPRVAGPLRFAREG